MGEAEIVAENARQWESINSLTAEVKVLTGTVPSGVLGAGVSGAEQEAQ